MSKELAKLFASRFIQRPGIKAIQLAKPGGGLGVGDWFPDTRVNAERRPNSPHLPLGFNMDHLLAHISGERTYGHYLLDEDSNCKFFAFDIDIEKSGSYVKQPVWSDYKGSDDPAEQEEWYISNSLVTVVEKGEDETLRDLWVSRKASAAHARTYLKWQMKTLAHILASRVVEMGIDCAVSYSGSKGVHVYGMTGSNNASEIRDAAMIAMDMTGQFEPARGDNFFRHKSQDPHNGFPSFLIEVFPKQTTMDGKSFGNLMRLPLGTNHKNAKDPTFFLDMTKPLGDFTPVTDPARLLREGNPFK